MRAVNLIPKDQRRAVPGARATLATYALLGVLAAALLIVSALVITSNQINSRKEKVAKLESKAAGVEKAANALESYGNFARLQEARVATVKALAESRFNWERTLRSLARTIPSDVWLTGFKGTVSPDIDLESEGGGGGTGSLREKTTAPAVELVGCTYSHTSVARMMVRMRNIDGVSEVALNKSERPEAQSQSGTAPAEGVTEGGGGGDCRTRSKITKFEILVVLGNARVEPPAAPQGAGTTPAAGQAQPAAAPTGGGAQSTPTSTGGGQ